MQEISLQFGSPFKLCFPGEGQWQLFVEEYWPWLGGICKCLHSWYKCPGIPWGQPPGMAADKCIIRSVGIIDSITFHKHVFVQLSVRLEKIGEFV